MSNTGHEYSANLWYLDLKLVYGFRTITVTNAYELLVGAELTATQTTQPNSTRRVRQKGKCLSFIYNLCIHLWNQGYRPRGMFGFHDRLSSWFSVVVGVMLHRSISYDSHVNPRQFCCFHVFLTLVTSCATSMVFAYSFFIDVITLPRAWLNCSVWFLLWICLPFHSEVVLMTIIPHHTLSLILWNIFIQFDLLYL